MTVHIHLKPVLALVCGIVALTVPRFERVAVAVYLITIGVLGILGR